MKTAVLSPVLCCASNRFAFPKHVKDEPESIAGANATFSLDTPTLPSCTQLQTPRPSLGFSKRVALRTPDEFTPRRFVRLRFDEGATQAEKPMPSTPFDGDDSDTDDNEEGGVAWPMTPETGGRVCRPDSECMDNSFNRERDLPLKSMSLTPDPSAFGSEGLRRKTPRTKRPVCPPTPAPPMPLERHASLWEAKILDSLRSEEAGLDRIFRRDFCDITLIGSGSFFEVYKARSCIDNRIYAIKRSRKTFRGRSDRYVNHPVACRTIGYIIPLTLFSLKLSGNRTYVKPVF